MFDKILVAIDCSSEALRIFNYALSLAQAEKSEILIVHFLDWQVQDLYSSIANTSHNTNIFPIEDCILQSLLKDEADIVNEWLRIFVMKAKQLNISCKSECHIGSCNSGIIDRVKDWHAELIIIGHRSYRKASKLLPASVSNYVIEMAPCPILIVPESKALINNDLAIVSNADSSLAKNSK